LSTNSKDYDDDDDDDDVYFRDNKQMNKHCIHELRPLPTRLLWPKSESI